jgi:uncharacterized membrane protein
MRVPALSSWAFVVLLAIGCVGSAFKTRTQIPSGKRRLGHLSEVERYLECGPRCCGQRGPTETGGHPPPPVHCSGRSSSRFTAPAMPPARLTKLRGPGAVQRGDKKPCSVVAVDLGSQEVVPGEATTPAARVRHAAQFILSTFGPLLIFLLGQWWRGTLIGIAAAVVWSAGDLIWRLAHGKASSRLFWLTTLLTLTFGSFDLALGKAVLFRFEAVLTNALTGLYFGLSVVTGKSVLEELYEKSQPAPGERSLELKGYLRLFTVVWAVYFLSKAALYCWFALVLPLGRLVFIRSIVGTSSLLALLGAERAVRMPLFRYLKVHGYLTCNRGTRQGSS